MTFRFGKHKTAILLISRTLRVVLRLKISIIGLLVVFVRRSLRSGLMLINFNKLLNKWTKTINVSCLSPLIELTNHMRTHSVWLSTAPKLEKCVTCPRSISKNQTFSAWNLLCICHVSYKRQDFECFFCLVCTKMYLKGLATESILF